MRLIINNIIFLDCVLLLKFQFDVISALVREITQ